MCDGDSDCSNGQDENVNVCAGHTHCTVEEFTCERSGECLAIGYLCNGVKDCTDGSDEFECDAAGGHPRDLPSPNTCAEGYYSCDEGICWPTSTQCDGELDCMDETDEASCDNHDNAGAIRIKGLTVDGWAITSTSLQVDWWIPDISNSDSLEYSPAYSVVGTDRWFYQPWIKINDFKYTFTGLVPYTQ